MQIGFNQFEAVVIEIHSRQKKLTNSTDIKKLHSEEPTTVSLTISTVFI